MVANSIGKKAGDSKTLQNRTQPITTSSMRMTLDPQHLFPKRAPVSFGISGPVNSLSLPGCSSRDWKLYPYGWIVIPEMHSRWRNFWKVIRKLSGSHILVYQLILIMKKQRNISLKAPAP